MQVNVIYTDIKMAFYTVNINSLVNKLEISDRCYLGLTLIYLGVHNNLKYEILHHIL